jgi:hypothetical protein
MTCATMAAETDITILLSNYNSQLQLNTTEGNQCAATLAAEINSILQSNLNQPPSVALREDMLSLLQMQEDAQVHSKQTRQITMLWVIVSLLLLMIIVYLWNFK